MNGAKWRFLNTGYSDGYTNMAVDEAILAACLKDQAPPTVRFYGWKPPTVSIGYFQKLEKEIDVEACKEMGFGIVRRPTGGKMVLHDEELTYSVIARQGQHLFPGDILGTYLVISQALIEGLKKLGVYAQMVPRTKRDKSGPALRSAACFSAPSSYEVMVCGKKLIGSAQKRHRDGVVQHGSILINFDLDRLMDVQKFRKSEHRKRMHDFLAERMTYINEWLSEKTDFDEVAEAMRTGFQERFGDAMGPGSLSRKEQELVERFRETKYSTEAWNYRRESELGI